MPVRRGRGSFHGRVHEHRYAAGTVIRHREVYYTVAVDVSNRDALRIGPDAKLWRTAKLGTGAPGAVAFRSTETVPSLQGTARSGLPSPSMSPTAAIQGRKPLGDSAFAEKLAESAPGGDEKGRGRFS